MQSIIRKLLSETLKAHWLLRQYISIALAKEFEAGTSTFGEKWALAHHWDDTLKETYILQLMMDLLERQEREERQINKSGVISSAA